LVLAFIAAAAASSLLLWTPASRSNAASSKTTLIAAPQAQADFVRQLRFTANDLVYGAGTKMLYASVPSSVGAGGNSITPIDPLTGVAESPVFIGSEPKRMALANDGNSLYVFLDGAAAIRRFDIPSRTPGLQFALGKDNFFGIYTLTDMAVSPGEPNVVAVARSYRGVSPPEAGVAIFDNGVQRMVTTPGHTAASDYLAYSASASTLYGGGFYSGLNTMTVDASGVSITSSKTFSPGNAIRFDNGLVYGSTGQVINPVNGSLLGTFSGVGSGPFTTDSAVGRAYFLTGSQSATNYTITLRAFDLSTFLSVGTLTIPGVNGNVSSLIRWGSNGLAFRSDGGQLFLVQSSLIPSADPIPTPTPTPSPTPTPTPTPFATFIRQVPLVNNDIAYSASTQLLYASIPSRVGTGGNSIRPVNPTDGLLMPSTYIGSEPTKLTMADDGQTLYAALDGAAAVRSLNVVSQVAGAQFGLGLGSFGTGLLFANDIAVLPGNPNSVVVSRANRVSSPSSDGVAVYDSGVPRSKSTATSAFAVETNATGDKVYSGSSNGIDRLSLDSTGVTFLSSIQMINGGDIRFDNGLLYASGGGVLDPEIGLMKGSFTGLNPQFGGSSFMTTDSANHRAFFITFPFGGSSATLRAFDLDTFLPLGSVALTIPNIDLTNPPSRLIRWGTNGLAFRTASQIIIIQTELVSTSGSVPTPTPSPSPTPSPTATPYIATFIKQIDLPANDLVYNSATSKLHVSVPSIAGANGNSITTIDPQSMSITGSTFVGSEPNLLALSDDGSMLHVSLDGAAAIRLFNVSTQSAGTQFSWGTSSQRPLDMAVVPGSPNSLATTDGTGFGVAIYDSGVRRANASRGGAYSVGSIAFGAPNIIYGYDSASSGFELVKLTVDANGVTGSLLANNLFSNFASGIQYRAARLYHSTGRVADPEAKTLFGTFQMAGSQSIFTVDPSLGRAFFLFSGSTPMILTAYDINNFLPVGSVTLPGVSGRAVRLVRWGSNGLAFNTVDSFGSTGASKVYLLQSALVSNAAPIPTGVQVSSATVNTFEGVGNLGITVLRSGDVSAATSVDYATSDGTATAGSDYTATSGTITFAPGELSKVLTVPIIRDSLFENAAETFTLTISNPSGGATLSGPTRTTVTIGDSDSRPTISMPFTIRSTEGNSGTKVFTIPVTLSNKSVETVSVNYATSNGTAVAGSDYVAASGTLSFPPGTSSGSVNVTVNGDTDVEPDETLNLTLSSPVNASFISVSQMTATIANDDSSIQLSNAAYPTNEGANAVIITVTRAGDTSTTTSATYATSDDAGAQNCDVKNGKASSRCDYVSSAGIIVFTPGQASKTISVLLTDDAYAEGDENLSFTVTNPVGSSLGPTSTATITIQDNDSADGANAVDQTVFFVRQHYYDFLNRQPDQSGLDFWVGTITSCGSDPQCIEVKRINLSGAFFLSIEFQQTGYLVERLYKTAYGDATGNSNFPSPHTLTVPIVRLNEFLADTQQIGQGVIVGQGNWQQQLENNKQSLTSAFVQRQRFTDAFGSMANDQFLDRLNANAGSPLSSSERDQLLADLNSSGKTRAQVLRAIAEHPNLVASEFNRAFVLMQFFGYLRRNPDDPQDHDHTGYDFWLTKLNQFGGNFQNAEMVKAFISADEYRHRFGP
jgi:hypothetical protein